MTKDDKEQSRDDYEKWENSLEGIHYMLDQRSLDDKTRILIVETLLKVPKDVRDRVLYERVLFIPIGGHGLCTSLGMHEVFKKEDFERHGDYFTISKEIPVIVLNLTEMDKELKFSQMSTIAHEIAHYILEHHKIFDTIHGNKLSSEAEKEADDLIEKWGFERAYKSYEEFKKFEAPLEGEAMKERKWHQ